MSAIVDIYCRSATQDEETQAKLGQQEADCQAYCAEHGLTVSLVMHEVAPGLTYTDRPVFAAIRSRFASGMTNGVVVTTADRITRNLEQFAAFMVELASCQAKLYCAKDNLAESNISKLVELVLVLAADIEREKTFKSKG